MSTKTASNLKKTVLVRVLFCLTVVIALLVMAYYMVSSPSFMIMGTIVTRVQTDEKVVALTFDDGPLPHTTERTLAILRDKKVKATFFIIGKEAQRHHKQLNKIIKDGHTVGNHSYSHSALVFKTFSEVENEITLTDKIIRNAGYDGEIPFRAPYNLKLFSLPAYLSKSKRLDVSRDVLPTEGRSQSWENITKEVVKKVRPGSVILLHPMYKHTASSRQAIGPIIDELHLEGYRFVTIPELVKLGKVEG